MNPRDPHVQICHYCNELKEYCGKVNGGNNYYCTGCIHKINELDIDYWRRCTNTEFYESLLKEMRKGKEPRPSSLKPPHEFSILESFREHMREMGIDVPERKTRRRKTRVRKTK